MGLIRGGLLFIVTVLLFLSFLFGNLFLTLNLSLSYDNVHSGLVNFISDVAFEGMNLDDIIADSFGDMKLYCENNSEINMSEGFSEYVFSQQGETFVIPCDVVSQGPESVVNYSIGNFAEEIYYSEYDCNFWDCFEKTELPLFLVSAKAKDYWKSKFYYSFIISLILIILMFLLVEKKFNLPVLAGILLVLSSLPFMKINWLLSFISDDSYMQLLALFFSEAYTVFLITFILGVIVLALGLILKFFRFGFKVSESFSRLKKDKTEEPEKNEKPARKKDVPAAKEVKIEKDAVVQSEEEKTGKEKTTVKEKKVKKKGINNLK